MVSQLEKSLNDLKIKLNKCNENNSLELIDILKQLKKISPTKLALKNTGIGISINKISKSSDSDAKVKTLCKEILNKWKTDVSKPQPTEGSDSKLAIVLPPKQPSFASDPERPITPDRSSTTSKLPDNTPESDGLEFESTNDKLRDKSIVLLYSALRIDTNSNPVEILRYAIELEDLTFKSYANQADYKVRLRTLSFNLKDPNNPDLREWINSGDIPASRLCTMSTEEMASKQRKDEVEKLKKEALNEIISAGDTQAETDMFKCGKCGKRKCKYFQMQTRSADEPMTTFVTCVHCGNKWKFC